MNIRMTGIDHNLADVEHRERFSFTKSKQKEAMREIAGLPGVSGCVLLSTCNRTEVYVSTEEECEKDLFRELCRIKRVGEEESREYRRCFVSRQGREAARHLFALASGIRSRIVGEDQILMQVREALNLARESDTTDKVLEVLFRTAVTTGKKVRTEVPFSRSNPSAVREALEQLRKRGYDFDGKKCLVIGNGEMGRLSAVTLREMGADVTVTVRQYCSGEVLIPPGCNRIHYGERYGFIPGCFLVVSATASPNLTITKEELRKLDLKGEKVFLDLAVPRDIEPAVAELDGVTVCNIDDFQIDPQSEELKGQIRETEQIIAAGLEEFVSWYECREYIPLIHRISRAAARDVSWRMGKSFRQSAADGKDREELEASMEDAAAKVFGKLMFKLRDSVSTDMLRECLEAFASAYPEIDSRSGE